MNRVLALDFDGTIADTMPQLEDLAVKVFHEFDPTIDEDRIRYRYRYSAGRPFHEQIEWIRPHDIQLPTEAIAASFAEQKVPITMNAPAFPEVKDALTWCWSKDITLALISSTTADLLNPWLEENDIRAFKWVVGWKEDWNKSQKLLDLQPNYFMGDTRMDLAFAQAAGVSFLGIMRDPNYLPSGFSSIEEALDSTPWRR